MAGRVVKRRAARADLWDCAAHLAAGGVQVGRRFLLAAEAAFERLAEFPRLGAEVALQHSAASGLRRWGVPGFPNHVIFYRPIEDGIEVVRVLHGARDIEALFEE